jgi:hypothetical protein
MMGGGAMVDELSAYYADLLDGSYDCVDRIVLNAYHTLCYSPGGFRDWWRKLMNGQEDTLDNAHLMRLAGRFSRRVRAYAKAHGIPVIDCGRGERKHEIAEEYLSTHPEARGLFVILVARAIAPVWDVERSTAGQIKNLATKKPYVNHYSFHILDPEWGHLTIKMSGHPPFGAQIILNGHEYVAAQARRAAIACTKEGNCFTHSSSAVDLARVAETLSEERMIGRLTRVCERWIYTTCLQFALDRDEQERSGFRYAYSVYQVEYSRNLLFRVGGQLEQVFQGLIDRTRARLTVRDLKTIFGAKRRPFRTKATPAPRLAVVLERPVYDLTVFKLHFGALTLKAYTKGERVLRFEAMVHNTKALGCGRVVAKFPQIVARLRGMVEGFLTTLHAVDHAFVSDDTLDQLPLPAVVGQTRVGGVDLNKARMHTLLAAVLTLAPAPHGFRVADVAARVQAMTGQTAAAYGTRHAAYDLKKLRAKRLIETVPSSRRYRVPPAGVRTIAALVILRDKVIKPILAGTATSKMGRKPKNWSPIDEHYDTIRKDMQILFEDLGLAA